MLFIILAMLLEQTLCVYDRRVITSLKYSHYFVKPVIVNGEPAHRGQIPYLVSIKEPLHKLGNGRIHWQNLCGGSIISVEKVLTAAHCFEGNRFYYARHQKHLRIVAGNLKSSLMHSGNTETSEQAQWRKIKKVVLHSNFAFPLNDIALAFVDEDWVFTSTVNPIQPATKQIDYSSPCYSAGYGRTGYGLQNTLSPVMLVAKIDVIPRFKCSLLWEMNMNSFVCTYSVVGDVAMGDSGGPLICSDTLDPVQGDVLVGIVSGKNFDKTTLFTRVSAYREWIETDGTSGTSEVDERRRTTSKHGSKYRLVPAGVRAVAGGAVRRSRGAGAAVRGRRRRRPARRALLPGAQHLPRAVRGGGRRAGAGVPSPGPRLSSAPRLRHEAAGRGAFVPAFRPPPLTRNAPATETQPIK